MLNLNLNLNLNRNTNTYTHTYISIIALAATSKANNDINAQPLGAAHRRASRARVVCTAAVHSRTFVAPRPARARRVRIGRIWRGSGIRSTPARPVRGRRTSRAALSRYIRQYCSPSRSVLTWQLFFCSGGAWHEVVSPARRARGHWRCVRAQQPCEIHSMNNIN